MGRLVGQAAACGLHDVQFFSSPLEKPGRPSLFRDVADRSASSAQAAGISRASSGRSSRTLSDSGIGTSISRLIEIAEAGHLPQVEAFQPYIRGLLAFAGASMGAGPSGWSGAPRGVGYTTTNKVECAEVIAGLGAVSPLAFLPQVLRKESGCLPRKAEGLVARRGERSLPAGLSLRAAERIVETPDSREAPGCQGVLAKVATLDFFYAPTSAYSATAPSATTPARESGTTRRGASW
jgi:hypothetical protein